MPKILIETAPDQFQVLDGLALESSLDQLADLINQIGKDKLGLELDEVTMSIKVSAQGEVILLNQSTPSTGAMTLKFKRSHQGRNLASPINAISSVNPQVISTQVISTQISYKKLENLLANGQWQEANQETWDLLCTATHKSQGTPLTAADMEQIPCSSFNNIDKLWHRYSSGKFGFSAQSRIYNR